MTAKNLESICSQIKDIFEENDIKEVPSFFVIRMCKCGNNVVEDFMWYLKMLNLFEAQFELKKNIVTVNKRLKNYKTNLATTKYSMIWKTV